MDILGLQRRFPDTGAATKIEAGDDETAHDTGWVNRWILGLHGHAAETTGILPSGRADHALAMLEGVPDKYLGAIIKGWVVLERSGSQPIENCHYLSGFPDWPNPCSLPTGKFLNRQCRYKVSLRKQSRNGVP